MVVARTPSSRSARSRTIAKNKAAGANFEAIFRARAAASGYKALRNELSFRWGPGGRMVPVRADLDFRVLSPDGRVAFVDTKLVASTYFLPSRMDKHQVARAMIYNSFCVPAGFVVLFAASQLVVFYTGEQIGRATASSRFTPAQGLRLGAANTFALNGVFARVDDALA